MQSPSAEAIRNDRMKWRILTWGVMQSHTLYTEQRHSGSFIRTSHPALTRVNSSGFTLRSTHWYFSLGTWCLFPLVPCSGTREEQKLLITVNRFVQTHLRLILVPLCTCCLLHLLDRQKKKQKTTESTDPVVSWAVSLSSNTSRLQSVKMWQSMLTGSFCFRVFECSPFVIASRRLSASLYTYSSELARNSVKLPNTHTHTQNNIYHYCFLSRCCSEDQNQFLGQEI